jgi:hypothetical protein
VNLFVADSKGDEGEKQAGWEIDITDLEFSTKLGVGASGEVFKGLFLF